METTLFHNGKIIVTNKRFVVGDKTYAIADILGVEGVTKAQEYNGLVWTVIGASLFFQGPIFAVFGVGVFIWGVVSCFIEKPSYWVVLITASGREVVVKDDDKALVDQTVEALKQAMGAAGA